ncbi:Putative amidophosphoribosyltransferase (plasmid) [Mesorhizobium loti]|nr:Putative amidophosphoribosyltransferase [Mesorhizobium loti]BCH05130.1 hypothetical protein MesoLj131b_71290 [Mesorhizobium sp. 131-2-5]
MRPGFVAVLKLLTVNAGATGSGGIDPNHPGITFGPRDPGLLLAEQHRSSVRE